MRTYQDRVAVTSHAGGFLAEAAGQGLRCLGAALRGLLAAMERARTLRELQGLSNAALKDIGLERSQLHSAAHDIANGRDPRHNSWLG